MSVLLDGRGFLVDDAVKPFIHDRRIDLVAAQAAAAPVFPALPEFLMFDYVCEKDMVLLVKAIIPYAQERIDAGLATERLRFVPSNVGNTSFIFTPYVASGALALFDWQYDPDNTAATAANEPTAGGKGFTSISQEPKHDAEVAWLSPMVTYALVTPEQHFRVTFKLMPGTSPGRFLIPPLPPALPDPNAQRVDKAGCVVVGMQMTHQAYKQMVGEMQERKKHKAERHQILKDAWAWTKRKWGN
jgi:hypothetical protein